MIFGADKKDSGELLLEGKQITPRNPKEAIRRGICMISEDRKETGLFLIRPVFENMSIVQNEQSRMLLRLREEFKRVSDMVDKLRIHLATVEQDADSLSGGNQQKTLLGRWLLGDADVYIFDEPTKGVDIGAKEEIYVIITDLARQGKIIIMVSSDMPELISMSDRIGVMRDGEMVAIVPKEEATEQRLISEYLGFSNGEEV
jgi:ribose transport system ATP-binding protein